MVANDLLAALLMVESKGQNPVFSAHGDVAYQIKGNVACNKIVANIFTHRTPHPTRSWGWGQTVKIQLFRTWSCCISNKWNRECSNKVAINLPADPPPPPDAGGGVKRQNQTFSEYGHVAYQIKGNGACNNMVANILPAAPFHRPWGWESKLNFVQNYIGWVKRTKSTLFRT